MNLEPSSTVAARRTAWCAMASARRREATLCLAVVLCAASVASGCANPAVGSTATAPLASDSEAARVIVRFRSATVDPADAAFRARWAADVGVPWIDVIRPMSGGAYVVRVACLPPGGSPADRCAAAVDRLRRSDAVADVEIDARETHQR